MRIAYADPPYPGQAHLYRGHVDYAGEVDHRQLVADLATYDGWILHTSVPALGAVLALVAAGEPRPHRVCSWVKPFASFKPSVSVAYAWEPVLVVAARKPVLTGRQVMRDWLAEPITLRRGLAGAKPERVCHWLFELVGADPGDELADLYPGTGAVGRAWDTWRQSLHFPAAGAGP